MIPNGHFKVLQTITDLGYSQFSTIEVFSDGDRLLVADDTGQFKIISIIDGSLIKNFKSPHSGSVSIVLTKDEKFIFRSIW